VSLPGTYLWFPDHANPGISKSDAFYALDSLEPGWERLGWFSDTTSITVNEISAKKYRSTIGPHVVERVDYMFTPKKCTTPQICLTVLYTPAIAAQSAKVPITSAAPSTFGNDVDQITSSLSSRMRELMNQQQQLATQTAAKTVFHAIETLVHAAYTLDRIIDKK